MTISHRPASPSDRSFIIDAWVSSYRTSHSAGMISMESFHRVMWPEVERVLDMPGTVTVVAYETSAPADSMTNLYGFVSADFADSLPLVHFVYTKAAYRRGGIARGLMRAIRVDPEKPFRFTCKTAALAELIRHRKLPCAKFDPLTVRYATRRTA